MDYLVLPDDFKGALKPNHDFLDLLFGQCATVVLLYIPA